MCVGVCFSILPMGSYVFKIISDLFWVHECFACGCGCAPWVCLVPGVSESALGLWGMEFEKAVGHHVAAGN